MKEINFKEYKVNVNDNNTATIHCALKDGYYLCLLNREADKDFINGYKALGFSVSIEESEEPKFYPIHFTTKTELTKVEMEKIWNKINEDGLPV